MGEFKFVIRCLGLTCLVLIISQYRIGEDTLEAKAQYLLIESQISNNLRQSAAGGVKFIRTSTEDLISFVKMKMAHDDGGNRHEPREHSLNQ